MRTRILVFTALILGCGSAPYSESWYHRRGEAPLLKMASQDLKCSRSELVVVPIGDLYGGYDTVSVTGCGSTRTYVRATHEWTTVQIPDSPHLAQVFFHCDGFEGNNLKERSFIAMILSLQEREWAVEKMDLENGEIVARECYRDDPQYCVTVSFVYNDPGRINATTMSIHRKLQDDIRRWLTALEQTYSKYRCYTDEALREEAAKYGISL